jgi:hypothetical protein
MSANKRFLELLDELRDTHVRKSAGYSGADNPDTWANFRLSQNFGISPFLGCLVRMSDKFARVGNLVKDSRNEQVGEGIKDTLIDLASYALIAICLLEEK